ncbi:MULTISPECIES: porin [Paraburkholderia]|jgi:predicted porin|uniref:Outer membrane protein (Porin) n=1 Tax=Paraburkholderia phenazinium TaxID=60549 RepID=A0A1N6HXS4_9BURK|nr:porin [Paraburkholderia phenazinium]SIO24612.1 Outer membrane protein (porin) [Paraburkholderia phenazinium]
MKKLLLAFAALGTFTGAAQAQSSVTLYGIVDAGYVYANNIGGSKLYEATGGALQADRWGLRGTEDLGGGLKAVFVLENGFSVFTGKLSQGGDEFGRQAYVGLSNHFGTVTVGRQYDSVVDYTGTLEVGAQWATYLGAHPGDLDNMNNTLRANNSIKFTSSNYSGIKFGGLYSLGGVAGQFNRNQIFSGGIGYVQGPLRLDAAYLNVRNPNYSFFGNNSTSSATGSNMTGSTVYSGYASAKTQQVIAAGGAYTFGAATVGATYSNTQFKDLGQTGITGAPDQTTSGSAKFHNAELNFRYQVTPALLLGAAYDYTKGYGVNDAKYHQGILGADYFVSTRTDFYVDAVYQHASGTDSTGHTAVADINGLSPSSTSNQVAAVVGIRHKF